MAIVGQCLVCFEEIRNACLFAVGSQTFLVALGYYTVGVATRCYHTGGVALTVCNLGVAPVLHCC